MQTNDHKIRNYDLVLDETFGKQGTPERAKAEEDAYNFYSGQILKKSRSWNSSHLISAIFFAFSQNCLYLWHI